jgi:electron transfer flavoprotein beta subunit
LVVHVDTFVLTKGVPDFREGQVSFDEDGHLERGKTPTVMNPNDEHALRAALQTRVRHGGSVRVLSMGPPGYKEVLQEAMETAYADDLTLVSDRAFAAADTWATAITLATAVEHLGRPDLLLAGFKTADGETGHTGPQTCWGLGLPVVTHVVSLSLDPDERRLRAQRLVEGDVEEIETVACDLPAFVVTDPEFEPGYRTAGERLEHKRLRATARERAGNYEQHLTTLDHEQLNLDPDYVGLDGSPTIVESVDPIPKAPAEREATPVDPDDESGMRELFEQLRPHGVATAAEGGD